MTWFSGDVWDPDDEAHRDILAIRKLHSKLGRLFNSPSNNSKVTNVTVMDKGHLEPSEVLYPDIRQDLEGVAEFQLPEEVVNQDPVLYISQFDMSVTQYAFMGLVISHPEKLGAGGVTEEEFAGLIHFWRGIGWLLGIKDKYNFCNGTVQQTRELCLEVENLFIAHLSSVDWSYEQMTSSIIIGMGKIVPCISYLALFRYLAYTLDIPVPSVVSKMSFRDTCNYWVWRTVTGLCNLSPTLENLLTRQTKHAIEKAKMDRELKLSMFRYS